MKTYHIASGIIRKNDTMLMIQQGADDEKPYWFIPGGVIEAGETIETALKREIQEETGIISVQIGKLAYIVQVISDQHQTMAFVFDVPDYAGDLTPNDPDNLIHDSRWMRVSEAIHHADAILWLSMKQPLVAYLRGEAPHGTIWQYRQHGELEYELLSCLPSK